MKTMLTEKESVVLKEALLTFVHSTISENSETQDAGVRRERLFALPRILEIIFQNYEV